MNLARGILVLLAAAGAAAANPGDEPPLRAVIDREIETYDPYESKVMVWKR